MTGKQIRQEFLDFFASKNHLILPSFPLIPENDPTLLLIGAGMAPFKPFFTGKMNPPRTRIATSQKCVRTGDIENVGRTARHHTFFEMLGNFSFGDYFKKEAITWAWEFITEKLAIPRENLWVTIHPTDEEAYQIWHDEIKLPAERIVRLEDNFWEIGPGPCGPCSEIYYDLGPDRGCGRPDCGVGCDCDRYLEIWNLVFTQYNRSETGEYTPLAKKNIDTGAGLERIASVLQGKNSNFETDLLFPLVEQAAALAGVTYGQAAKTDTSLKVIADHSRSMVIMIADGILPANEGRGYVLRRILRRAVRHGRLLGITESFLAGLVEVVLAIFGDVYPDLADKKTFIQSVVRQEEERFQTTLEQGLELLTGQIDRLAAANEKVLDGATAFKLYDTFGFPWELTGEILNEHGFTLDKTAFDQAMAEQRDRARAARQERDERIAIPDLSGLLTAKTVYDPAAQETELALMWKEGQVVGRVAAGEEITVILAQTPFYAEGGGQVGDIGFIEGPGGKMQVTSTRKLADGTIYHTGSVLTGALAVADRVKPLVDGARKRDIARNHTATHLLQAALKKVVGPHVNQAGSSVDNERLRFDFTHFAAVTPAQLAEVEKIVNEVILQNRPVSIIETTQETARQMGAMALFGEKYGEIVRVVLVDDFSRELCGGTHVDNTAAIGLFKITAETGIGSGIRRIEAVTGHGAYACLQNMNDLLNQSSTMLKTRPDDIPGKLAAVLGKVKELEHEMAALNSKLAKIEVQELLAGKKIIGEFELISAQVTAGDMDSLRSLADLLKAHVECGVVSLGAVFNERANFVVTVSPAAVAKGLHAGKLVKEMAKVAGGGGGGRPDMAQAGGKQPAKIAEALKAGEELIKKI